MQREYRGYQIKFDSNNFHFTVKFDEEDFHQYASNREAEEAIDKHIKDEELTARKKFAPIAALTENSEQVQITGIHARSKTFLVTPKSAYGDHWQKPNLYLDCPKVSQLIKERIDLNLKLKSVDARLKPFALKLGDVYRMEYNEIVENFLASVAKAKEQAK